MRKWMVQLYTKNNEVIFSLAWNIIFNDNFKCSSFEIFGGKEHDIFEPKSWRKYDIYWLLRSSCFELFGDGKYGLFSAKKLMERWYSRGLFELSMIFQDLGNVVFRAVQQSQNKCMRFCLQLDKMLRICAEEFLELN